MYKRQPEALRVDDLGLGIGDLLADVEEGAVLDEHLIDIEPEWVHLNTDENGVKMNAYFVDHPEMVLGDWKTVSGRFGEEDTVVPYENADLAELLDEAISNIHAEITDYEVDEELTEEDNSIPADPEVRNFSYTVVDDKIYYRCLLYTSYPRSGAVSSR